VTRITHVMRDGTVRHDISGYIVKYEEAKSFYDNLRIKKRRKHI
jgi:hypothetical protein